MSTQDITYLKRKKKFLLEVRTYNKPKLTLHNQINNKKYTEMQRCFMQIA